MIKFTTKALVASALLSSAAFAKKADTKWWFIGLNAGANNTTWKSDVGGSVDKTAFVAGIDGGMVFQLTHRFAMSAELFFDWNTASSNATAFGFTRKLRQPMFFGAKTRAIFDINDMWNVYVGVGLGGMDIKYELQPGIEKENKLVLAIKALAGVEFAATDNLNIYLDFVYDGALTKLSTTTASDIRVDNFGGRVGVRWFFP